MQIYYVMTRSLGARHTAEIWTLIIKILRTSSSSYFLIFSYFQYSSNYSQYLLANIQESFFIVQCFWKLGLILLFRWIQPRGECSLCIRDEGMKNWCKASWEIHRFIFSWFSVVSCYQHVDSLHRKNLSFNFEKLESRKFCCWHDWGSSQWALLGMPKVLWRHVADHVDISVMTMMMMTVVVVFIMMIVEGAIEAAVFVPTKESFSSGGLKRGRFDYHGWLS